MYFAITSHKHTLNSGKWYDVMFVKKSQIFTVVVSWAFQVEGYESHLLQHKLSQNHNGHKLQLCNILFESQAQGTSLSWDKHAQRWSEFGYQRDQKVDEDQTSQSLSWIWEILEGWRLDVLGQEWKNHMHVLSIYNNSHDLFDPQARTSMALTWAIAIFGPALWNQLPPLTRSTLLTGEPSASFRSLNIVLFSLGLSHWKHFWLVGTTRSAI